jgi:hypothetical protein
MKKFLALLSLILGSITIFATLPTTDLEISPMAAPKLFPADYPACMDATTTATPTLSCEMGTEFYMDHMGRCGCLSKNQITPADTCMRAYIICNALAGESFSLLFQGMGDESVNAGCGCFGTHEGMSQL